MADRGVPLASVAGSLPGALTGYGWAGAVPVLLAAGAGWLCWPRRTPVEARVLVLTASLRAAAPGAGGRSVGEPAPAGWLRRARTPLGRLGTRLRRHRDLARRRSEVIALCDALSGELRAGRAPVLALRAAVAPHRPLTAPRSAGPPGGGARSTPAWAALGRASPSEVGALLERASAEPGRTGLRQLGVCWQVAEESGAALAEAVDRVAEHLRDEERVRREVSVLLAGPRATARLLAALPVVGLLLGLALGADPLGVLIGTPLGRGCGLLGLLLAVLGWFWTRRLAAAVDAL